MFENLKEHPRVESLCENWQSVLAELQSLAAFPFFDWPEDIYQGTWQVFPLYKFGDKVEATCRMCPQTTALLEAVPGMVMAGFSKMRPDTHIYPHHGYTGAVLRFHLGLIGGEDCGIRVGNETRSWSPGSAFVFDDTQEHEAWNRGSAERIILLMDFKRDASAVLEFSEELKQYGADEMRSRLN